MSTLKVNTIQDTAGVQQYLAKAWVNFNGTGTVAIMASGGVSSISDNGVGSYSVNFSTAMQDSDYSLSGMAGRGSTFGASAYVERNRVIGKTTTAVAIRTADNANGTQDCEEVFIQIFR